MAREADRGVMPARCRPDRLLQGRSGVAPCRWEKRAGRGRKEEDRGKREEGGGMVGGCLVRAGEREEGGQEEDNRQTPGGCSSRAVRSSETLAGSPQSCLLTLLSCAVEQEHTPRRAHASRAADGSHHDDTQLPRRLCCESTQQPLPSTFQLRGLVCPLKVSVA